MVVLCNPKALLSNEIHSGKTGCFYLYFDSLGTESDVKMDQICNFLTNQALKYYNTVLSLPILEKIIVKVPKQKNGCDCGVFLLKFFTDFMTQPDMFMDKKNVNVIFLN